MTNEEIMNMPAGREMDAMTWLLIHNKQIDLLNCRYVDGDVLPSAGYPIGHISPPHYSTDMDSAWLVVEKFDNRCMLNNVHGVWECYFEGVRGEAKTASLAICRAALLAVNG